jgi:predicted MPP superfamily phosphohydrolase
MLIWVVVGLGALAVSVLAYGWFEAGWLRTRVLELPVQELPGGLDGLRIAHLSDFHFGPVSRGRAAGLRAADWVRERRPDLVVVTGDLLSRRSGRADLDTALAGLDAYAVLGNHDVAVTRDPFSRAAELDDLPATVLHGASRLIRLRGLSIQLAGTEPYVNAAMPAPDDAAAFRILLSHYPRLRTAGYGLVLSGHMHAGQIVVPYPRGRIRLAHLRAPLAQGIYRSGGVTLHVSPGLGTTFVPFRFFARPEVTELVLRSER